MIKIINAKIKIAFVPVKCSNCFRNIWLERYIHEEWLITISEQKKRFQGDICYKCLLERKSP